MYKITDKDSINFKDGVFYVNEKPFRVIRIDGDPPSGPVVGISDRKVIVEFRCFTNEWDVSLVEGCH